jgi:hypothetical protein
LTIDWYQLDLLKRNGKSQHPVQNIKRTGTSRRKP